MLPCAPAKQKMDRSQTVSQSVCCQQQSSQTHVVEGLAADHLHLKNHAFHVCAAAAPAALVLVVVVVPAADASASTTGASRAAGTIFQNMSPAVLRLHCRCKATLPLPVLVLYTCCLLRA